MQGALRAHHVVEPRKVEAEHVAIEEEDGRQRLVLGRRGDVCDHRERRKDESQNVGTELRRVAPAARDDQPAHPADVGPLRAAAVPACTELGSQAVEQARSRARFAHGALAEAWTRTDYWWALSDRRSRSC